MLFTLLIRLLTQSSEDKRNSPLSYASCFIVSSSNFYFLLDLSKTVTELNLETAIGMIRNMIRLFSYGEDGVKIAIGTFALTFGEVFPFSKYDTRNKFFHVHSVS